MAVQFKVGHSSNFLYQVFFRYLLKWQSLKPKRKFGVSVHLIEQWCNEVHLFALKSDFCFNLLDPHKYFTVFYYDNKCCSVLS